MFNTIFGVIILLGILILVHEWGHFLAARFFGVRVDIFSIGFGPRIYGRKRGPTDYRISLLPLGGYVKMAGDNPLEERTGSPDEFLSKPRWQRAIIALAGPTMNIALAFLLVAGLFFVGMEQPAYLEQPAVIAGIPRNSPAEKSGLKPGDQILAVNGKDTKTWERVIQEVVMAPSAGPLELLIDRGGQEMAVTTKGAARRDASDVYKSIGYPSDPVIVGDVRRGKPIDSAGITPGDEIVSINGEPAKNPFRFTEAIQESQGNPVTLEVLHERQKRTVRLEPYHEDPADGGGLRWLVGMGFDQAQVRKSHPLGQSLSLSWQANMMMGEQILGVVGQLFQGKMSLKQLGGPIEIGRQAGRALKQGADDFVRLMAVISMNLAILNLLPIPILDGGHILMLGIEGALRRDMSITFKERFVQVGLVFLLAIFVVVMYNDVLKTWVAR